MDRQLPPCIARAAAAWWGGHLRQVPRHDWGERDPMAQALAIVATDCARKKADITEAKIAAFERELAAIIERQYHADPFFHLLGVDYGPCPVLSEAGEKAGIASLDMLLPVKTWMNIWGPGDIEVCEGYGAPFKRLAVPSQP